MLVQTTISTNQAPRFVHDWLKLTKSPPLPALTPHTLTPHTFHQDTTLSGSMVRV